MISTLPNSHLEYCRALSKNPKWIRTLCPVPPFLAQALGYRAGANLVGIYWDVSARQLILNDGVNVMAGNSYSFLAFYEHPAVKPFLEKLNFGFSDPDHSNWLVLDRAESILYCVNKECAADALLGQGDDLFGSLDNSAQLTIENIHEILDSALYDLDRQSVGEDVAVEAGSSKNYFASLQVWLNTLK